MHVVHLPQPVAKVKPERESKQLAVEQKFVPLLKMAPLLVPKPMPEPTPKPMPEQMPQPALDPVAKADTVTASFSDESTGMEESVSKFQRASSLQEALLLVQGKIATSVGARRQHSLLGQHLSTKGAPVLVSLGATLNAGCHNFHLHNGTVVNVTHW